MNRPISKLLAEALDSEDIHADVGTLLMLERTHEREAILSLFCQLSTEDRAIVLEVLNNLDLNETRT